MTGIQRKIKVLVVDDSKYMRYVISKILTDDPELEVIGEARDGVDGFEKIMQLKPDVVTLDVEMPRMDGFETLKKIMATFPLPVIMVSKYTETGGGLAIRALQSGAVDFVRKPEGRDSLTMSIISKELTSKIKVAATLKLDRIPGITTEIRTSRAENVALETVGAVKLKKVVVLCSSTGGPRALTEVMAGIPAGLPVGILIVQHMPSGFTASLATRLNEVSAFNVTEAKSGDMVSAGKALVAPGDFHMRIKTGGRVQLSLEGAVNNVRPAADVTLEDAAREFGKDVICVIMTGMGRDGTKGGKAVKERGGVTVAQEGSTCVVNGMPESLVAAGHADAVVRLDEMAAHIISIV